MSGETRSGLIARMDQALDRIETALRNQSSAQAPVDDGLARRHAALRTSTAAALRDLDGLIASEEAR
jgi:hypothetical protein